MNVFDRGAPPARTLLAAVVLLAIGGCGGGGGATTTPVPPTSTSPPPPPPTTNPERGVISIAFSDAPISDEFEHALMVISDLRLLSSTSGHDVSIFLAEPIELDLLQLASFSEVIAEVTAPIGVDYSVRFTVDSLTLVRQDGSTEDVSLENLGAPAIVDAFAFSAVRIGSSNPVGRVAINIEIPLDAAIQRRNAEYVFRPVAIVTGPDGLFRLSGTVDQIVARNAIYPNGAFRLCDLQRVSDHPVSGSRTTECAFVAARTDTAYFDAEANVGANGFAGLTVNDAVVVYAWYDYYNEEQRSMDSFTAFVVARGAGFERVRGTASDFATQTRELTLNSPSDRCPSRSEFARIGLGDSAPVFRETTSYTEPVTRGQIKSCLGAEAEGFRVAPDVLRSFVLVLRPQTVHGTLSEPAVRSVADRYDLITAGAPTQCIDVGAATRVRAYHYKIMGVSLADTTIVELLGEEVVVVGEQASDGCLDADSILFVQ